MSRIPLFQHTLAVAGLSLVSSLSVAQSTSWEIQQVGLTTTGLPYVGADYAQFLNNQGGVAGGTSYSVPGYPWIRAAKSWVYDGVNTIEVGLTDDQYVFQGYQRSTLQFFNDQGQAAGSSLNTFYEYVSGGSGPSAEAAWFYDGNSTIELGLTGSDYTGANGYQYSEVQYLTDQGQVVGASRTNTGVKTLWLYEGGNTSLLGLSGSEFEDANGYTRSNLFIAGYDVPVNSQGQITGITTRMQGVSSSGVAAWFYDGNSSVRVGLTGSDHTSSSGVQYSNATLLNERGQVAGYSRTFTGDVATGSDAWLYDAGTTIQLGLLGAGYESTDGRRSSGVADLNDNGYAVGSSHRYSGNTKTGSDAWIYDGTTTTRLEGLTDSTHTRASDGYQSSNASKINNQNQVVGSSQRYNGDQDAGNDYWFYDGTDTTKIQLTESDYISGSDQVLHISVTELNELGQVAGVGYRYEGGDIALGQTAWLYDSGLDQTFEFNLFENSNGYSSSQITYLGDDGLVLGFYGLFDDTDQLINNRVFYFTIDEGVVDFTDMLLQTGLDLTAEGWDTLLNTRGVNALGQIIGQGILSDGSNAAYILTPSVSQVPVPAAVWLFGTALMGLFGLKRRALAR